MRNSLDFNSDRRNQFKLTSSDLLIRHLVCIVSVYLCLSYLLLLFFYWVCLLLSFENACNLKGEIIFFFFLVFFCLAFYAYKFGIEMLLIDSVFC